MKIAFVGGGTGGHFYPHIAVTEAIEAITEEKRLLMPNLYYMGPSPFDPQTLIEHAIEYIPIPAGKLRRYGSILNIIDSFVALIGVLRAIPAVYSLYPDVFFSTGGYAAFPPLAAAKLLRIPVVLYDADAKPGRVSLWSARFAERIAVAHPEASLEFPLKLRSKIARVGHPVRQEILGVLKEGGYEFLHLDAAVPTILVMGGSQGARTINETLLDALAELVTRYNVIHQTGAANLNECSGIASVILRDSPHKERYRAYGLLNALALRMAAGASNVVIARAGSGTIFEIAAWGKPSILIPIPSDVSHDQIQNAFSYARAGGASVVEQANLSPHVLIAEIDRLMSSDALRRTMAEAAAHFAQPDAARKIAETLLEIGISHEPT